ncbi:MAG: hypothetical protein PQJ46_14010 [Spirochaetales bacterium]|nr:hypothetical protein [Spirochaetales bacterium]
MSVSPLDMQILYSNLKNVGQQHAAERGAEIAQQDKKADEIVRKAEERDHKVDESKDVETGVDKINEEPQGKGRHNEKHAKKDNDNKNSKEDEVKTEKKYFEDPDIGHHIDISG